MQLSKLANQLLLLPLNGIRAVVYADMQGDVYIHAAMYKPRFRHARGRIDRCMAMPVDKTTAKAFDHQGLKVQGKSLNILKKKLYILKITLYYLFMYSQWG